MIAGNQLLLAARVEGPEFSWPEDRAPLKPGQTYHLEVMELQTVIKKIAFRVVDDGQQPTVIIALD